MTTPLVLRCSSCKAIKTTDSFCRDRSRSRGFAYACKACKPSGAGKPETRRAYRQSAHGKAVHLAAQQRRYARDPSVKARALELQRIAYWKAKGFDVPPPKRQRGGSKPKAARKQQESTPAAVTPRPAFPLSATTTHGQARSKPNRWAINKDLA